METTVPLLIVDDNRTEGGSHIKPLVSYELLDTFSIVNDFALCSSVSLFGIFSNIANVIVYSKIGFAESSNINFLALSVIDFLVSVVTFFLKIFYSPVLRGLSTGPTTSILAIGLSPAMMVTVGASAMMTALISAERCLCVVFPLRRDMALDQAKPSTPAEKRQGNDKTDLQCEARRCATTRSNELLTLLGLEDLNLILKERRLRWYGHVERSSGAIKTALDMQVTGSRGKGRPRMTWKQVTERDRKDWKLSTTDPHDRNTWRSGVRSAMRAASQLPGRGPLMWMLPQYLHIKTFLTHRRVVYLVLAIVVYQMAFLCVVYIDTGPPYDKDPKKQAFYYFCFFAIPSTTCFFIVVIATIILVFRLRKNLQWRRETSSQSEKTSDKENRIMHQPMLLDAKLRALTEDRSDFQKTKT
ncbi:hypothetical protein EGW08_021362 [Elysia chlorotica]|uniref:G-protein coupled receptors family 1 profile domain-containing protein n=1 Tax=Elysia chlorotica TaxID=188477 RepID=A0A433SNZ8_ELYCH|nr:hypothetical protein EGW08_021362 [Elysia chlorotica]